MKPGLTGIPRILAATKNSLNGIRDCWRYESAFRQNSVISVMLLILSFHLAQTVVEWLILVIPLFLLAIVELLNSAIENIVDRIGPERHILSGRAKDSRRTCRPISFRKSSHTWWPKPREPE